MMGLSDGERISMIRSAFLIQYTRVSGGWTDGRTDGIDVAYTHYSIYGVARKNDIVSRRVFVSLINSLYRIILRK